MCRVSAAHVCDECKAVAPLEEALGWWSVTAMTVMGHTVLHMYEKDEYHFCSWACLTATGARLAELQSVRPG
jgi:hypothetical protein